MLAANHFDHLIIIILLVIVIGTSSVDAVYFHLNLTMLVVTISYFAESVTIMVIALLII